MQLWYAPTSPFARKTRIAAHELGLAASLELIEANPWTDTRLRTLNPLAKVPTLVLDSGQALIESAVICEYFDSLAGGGRLFPPPGEARWRALGLQGLADGAATAAGRLFADEHRRAEERSDAMMARFRTAIEASLDQLERQGLEGSLTTIGEVSAAALLGYLDFRWPERDWRKQRPQLAAWFAEVERRPSMIETRHRLPD
jgi:glutathione S-transferase